MIQKIRRTIVALDNTKLDVELVQYANFLANTTEIEHIYFVHVLNLQLPANIIAEFPNLEKDALEERKNKIHHLVARYYLPERKVEYSAIIVQSSNTLKGLLQAIGKFDADLVVIGRVKNREGVSVIIQRLARRAPCHVLIVPGGTFKKTEGGIRIKTLLVPIDFSEYAAMALERAMIIARRNKDKNEIEIVCQHVYKLPSGFHLTGKTEEEFSDIMCTNAKESYDEFISKIDTEGVNIRVVYSKDINDDLTSDIRDLASEIDADGIVIGSKGKTATAALFLGSFAEKLITNSTKFSLLVVRKKKDYSGILDRLKKL